jgi:co-chaperonin GroES (HSP10)
MAIESKYLKQFSKLGPGDFPLRGNRLIVELLPKIEVKTKGGLVLATSLNDHRTTTNENQADVAVVLAVGSGYYGDDGEAVPMDVRVGNVILLTRFGVRAYSTFPGLTEYTAESIALCRESDVHAAWPSIEAFNAYVEKLSG